MNRDEIEIELDNDNNIDIDVSNNDDVEINVDRDLGGGGTTNYERLRNKPQINSVELIGNKSLEDLGIENDKTYLHTQSEASSEWVITHNLEKYPSVTIINSAGDEVIGEVYYNSQNQVTITFSGAFKGTATLN